MAKTLHLRVFTGSELGSATVSYTPLSNTVPATRGDCPPKLEGHPRRCPHVRCRFHLAIVPGEQRAGRRVNGRSPPTTIRVLPEGAPTCTLDVADDTARSGEPLAIGLVGKALGLRASQVHAEIARALAKLRSAGLDLEQGDFPTAAGRMWPG